MTPYVVLFSYIGGLLSIVRFLGGRLGGAAPGMKDYVPKKKKG